MVEATLTSATTAYVTKLHVFVATLILCGMVNSGSETMVVAVLVVVVALLARSSIMVVTTVVVLSGGGGDGMTLEGRFLVSSSLLSVHAIRRTSELSGAFFAVREACRRYKSRKHQQNEWIRIHTYIYVYMYT